MQLARKIILWTIGSLLCWSYKAQAEDLDVAFIGKAARVLRYDKPIRSYEEINQYRTYTKEALVDEFMNDPSFGLTVLDFNLYFMSEKNGYLIAQPGEYKYQGQFDLNPGVPLPAITSAKAVMSGGDYFSLFDQNHAFLLNVRGRPHRDVSLYSKFALTPEILAQDDEEFVKSLATQLKGHIHNYLNQFADDATVTSTQNSQRDSTPRELCTDLLNSILQFFSGLNLLASDYERFRSVVQAKLGGGCQLPYSDFVWSSYKQKFQTEQIDPIVAVIDVIHTWPIATGEVPIIDRMVEPMPEVKSLLRHHSFTSHFFSFYFFGRYHNSSTNYNRRRAAAVLKQYFCDDLVPINVIAPENHAQGAHGSDPKCQSCHFKLDPMAGFFRKLGRFGSPPDTIFGGQQILRFDDNATANLSTYIANWQAPKGSIGYVVPGCQSPDCGSYGLSDLSGEEEIDKLVDLLRQSKEVDRCLVRRMAEYFVGVDRSFDTGWLDHLADDLSTQKSKNGTAAFRSVVRQLILSKAFSTKNYRPNICLDYAPGVDPSQRPPCTIASLFTQNCMPCHTSTSRSGGLALDLWENGTFPHSRGGQQQTLCVTAAEIRRRISSDNTDIAMPQSRSISNSDRAAIFKWADQEVTKCQ